MKKRTKVILIIGFVLILSVLLVVPKINKKKNNSTQVEEQISTKTNYDKEEALYKVVNNETGEVIYEGISEADAYLYTIDPSYVGSNPDAVDEYNLDENEE